MKKEMRIAGSLLMVLGVILGAMGSHYLKEKLPPSAMESFDIGIQYLIYHALALLLLSRMRFGTQKRKKTVFYMILLGILLFSGSIVILSFKSLIPFNIRWIGPLTPVGGGLLLAAWVATAFSFAKK